jgi:PAS domain S-box-containing protein
MALRRAADRVAGGEHDIEIPMVGPTELADLGRSMETMRRRLAGAERRFRDLLETSPDATVHVAAVGSIVLANRQAERLFGYPRQELVGQPVEMLVPSAARGGHPAHRQNYFNDPQFRPMGENLTLTAVHRDGHEIPVEISLGPLSTEEGPMVSVAVRDITERLAAQAEREQLIMEAESERYERRLAQSQRLESLGQLVGGVAHDFNNLLGIILGYTDFIRMQISATAETDPQWQHTLDDVQQVHGAAERAARLTHQLLAFGRREITKPEVLNLNDVNTGLEPLLRRTVGEHIELIVEPGPDLWPVKADPGHMEQILVNLVVNARDALPGGGKLTIDTANIVVDDTYATSRPGLAPGRYARLRVSDTGTGMDRETLDRVFEPFFTTKPAGQGTGLGLATVYGLIIQAGGYAQLYSEPGMGTTFSGLLPATEDTAEAAQQTPAAPQPAHGETVLLVEDEESLRDMVGRILTEHGYQVLTATAARHALELAADLDQPIHLLLTDVVMPTMLGREVAARLQAIRPAVPVLYMSGYAQDVLASQGTLDPGVELLEKPFSQDDLLHKIREVLGQRHPPED